MIERRSPRLTRTFQTEAEAKDFAREKYGEGLIVSAGTMHAGDKRMTTTLCTVEFLADGKGTHLILTDQSAFYGDEKAYRCKSGFASLLLDDEIDGVEVRFTLASTLDFDERAVL